MIRVLYFARLRELAGTGEEQLDETPATLAELIDLLQSRGGHWPVIFSGTVLMSVNQQMAQPQTELKAGDEVAFFPPVSGG